MLLEELSNAAGPSSYEGEVREIIVRELKDYVEDIKVDNMGNVLVHKKGNGPKVLLDAHMDEVGLIITGFNDDGTLRFSTLGGIYAAVLPAKTVLIGKNKLTGVIGIKPIHLQSKEERIKPISISNLCIDIGAINSSEARKYVNLGEYAVFDTKFEEFGEGLVKGKALDDRIGCAVLIEVLKENYNCNLYCSFSVQEEVGERGAFASSYCVEPDIGIAIEGTICNDLPGVSKVDGATAIGMGPAISLMDKTSIYDAELISDIEKVAKGKYILCQKRKSVASSNDAWSFHGTGEGARIAAISIPVRYIHSTVSIASLADYESTKRLIIEYLKTLK